jgi:hypothetical protein
VNCVEGFGSPAGKNLDSFCSGKIVAIAKDAVSSSPEGNGIIDVTGKHIRESASGVGENVVLLDDRYFPGRLQASQAAGTS